MLENNMQDLGENQADDEKLQYAHLVLVQIVRTSGVSHLMMRRSLRRFPQEVPQKNEWNLAVPFYVGAPHGDSRMLWEGFVEECTPV